MAITAAQVNELRQKTGAGMMDCKQRLMVILKRQLKFFVKKAPLLQLKELNDLPTKEWY